jgi:CHAT domain
MRDAEASPPAGPPAGRGEGVARGELRTANGGPRTRAAPGRQAKKSRAPKRERAARGRSTKARPALGVSRAPGILFHELVHAGKANDLVVWLSDAISRVERERLITVGIPAGQDSVSVVVRLSAPGFSLKPKPEQKIDVGREFDAKRERVTYKLTALDPGPAPLTREIRADFWLGNACVGAVTHRTTVVPAGFKGHADGDGTGRSTPFVLDDDRQECDLVMIVSATKDDGQPPFDIHFRSRIPGADYESRPMGRLQITPRELSKTLDAAFSTFVSKFPADGNKADIARWREGMRDAIDKLGKYLWGKLPEKFRAEYFRLYDAGLLPASIQVHSDEMIIPWELLVPNRVEGKAEVLKPLGVAHVMGRWRPGIGIQPRPQRMRIAAACVVNPKYPGDSQLLWSVLEAAELKKQLPVFQALSPATRATVTKLLARSDVQFVHYTGHGMYTAKQADLSTLVLEGGDKLAAMDFVAAKLLTKGKALIYLNACESGSTGVVMGQMGGFAAQCLTSGCSGIIAPYWAVADGTAKDFSLAFYGLLQGGRSIGEALMELRAKNRKDPTFQAFAYFGDPWTRPQFA